MTGRTDRQLVGRWRITEADLWERDFLDLVGPATMTIKADGHGEIALAPSRPTSTSTTPEAVFKVVRESSSTAC